MKQNLEKLSRQNFKKSEPDKDKPFEGKSGNDFENLQQELDVFDIATKQLGGSTTALNPDGIIAERR